MPLTDIKIRSAKPQHKTYKLFDSGGLYLEVTIGGRKYWRWKYRFGGKEKRLAFGVYPHVTLKMAREERDDARSQLASGVDPGEARKAEKVAQAGAESFEAIAREWHAKFSPGWVANHGDRILRRIESRGALETTHRAMQNCGQVFRYAVATGRAERDPSGDLRGALPPPKEKHHASIIDPKRIAELLRAIDAYQGFFATKCARCIGTAGFRPAWRIAQGKMAGDRPRQGGMAYPCR